MYLLHEEILRRANAEAVYNLYIYLADKSTPSSDEPLRSIVQDLKSTLKNGRPPYWKERDMLRLHILNNAVDSDPYLANSTIGNLICSENGLTACSFAKPDGSVSVVFRGTGKGEWIDNGEGLSGIPEPNIYITYGRNGEILSQKWVENDYATDQQVEALNWFCRITAQNEWDKHTHITVSGHSKGGNKAQFVTIHSDLVQECYSFDGQGFSPEALSAFQQQGIRFEEHTQKIHSLSADNDYINVLGNRAMPHDHIYFFESTMGFHHLEALLDDNGRLHSQCEQGKLSQYVEGISQKLMNMAPSIRQYASLGIMNLFQKYFGKGIPVNGDAVSVEKTIAGIGVAIGTVFPDLI